MQLQDQSLWRQQAYIGGEWCDAAGGAVIAVNNPADNSPLGSVPDMGEAETRRAIAAADAPCRHGAARPARNAGRFCGAGMN